MGLLHVPYWKALRESQLESDDLLNAFNAYNVPVDIHKLAATLGVAVEEASREDIGGDGALYVEGNTAVIFVDQDAAPVRQRFTVAHEIAHLVLHPISGVIHRDTGLFDTPIEREANKYAARLLMPADALYRLWKWEDRNFTMSQVSTLAQKFVVSRDAMKYRLQNLGILDV